MQTVSLMAANQQFSKILRQVERGENFIITRRGQPIAKLIPHRSDKSADPDWMRAYERMNALMDAGASLGNLRIDREALYDR